MLKKILAGAALAAALVPSLQVQATADTPAGFTRFHEWTRVDQPLADALAEGDAPDATTRHWEKCAVHDAAKPFTVVCPDGYVTTGAASHSRKDAFGAFGSKWQRMPKAMLHDKGWSFGMEHVAGTTVYVNPDGRVSHS